MKTILVALFSCLMVATVRAVEPAPAAPTDARPHLTVVVVDSLPRRGSDFNEFNLIAEEFDNAFTARHWPMKVDIERFAANAELHPLELKLFYQGIRNDFGERRFRAWTVLTVNNEKHDFGIVEYRYMPRPGQDIDEMIHRIFRGAGDKIASLVEPYIAPTAAKR